MNFVDQLFGAELLGAPFILFVGLLFPCFVSLRVYGLFAPISDKATKDYITEIASFGIANFAIVFLPLQHVLAQSSLVWMVWLCLVLAFIVVPAMIAFLFWALLRWLSRSGRVLSPHPTPWDDFFLERRPCWVIAHLPDGRRIYGKFGSRSRASLHPQPGHLYVEELWTPDDVGGFAEKVPSSLGVLLRPTDYSFIELFQDEVEGG
jgi:hypothetical protein